MMTFRTTDGVDVPAVTADQMREIDRVATEETGPKLLQMMENAGRSLASLTMDVIGAAWDQANIVVLAGSGGNGGGGICAARHLANRGAGVTLVLADRDRLSEVTRWQHAVYRNAGGSLADDVKELRPDLIVDALIGYGLHSAPRGRFAELIRWANASGAQTLALDVPSGLDATSGETPGELVKAAWTLTLALPKTGLRPEVTGELYLADIGIPRETYRRAEIGSVPPFRSSFVMKLVCGPG